MSNPLPLRRLRSPVPAAPGHLSPSSRRWWRQMVAGYEMDPGALRILEAAATTWDRALAARDAIATDGAVITDRFGALRPHPAVAIERSALLAYARLCRELAIDPAPPDTRPPSRYHER
jgi:phage terminase small subunit